MDKILFFLGLRTLLFQRLVRVSLSISLFSSLPLSPSLSPSLRPCPLSLCLSLPLSVCVSLSHSLSLTLFLSLSLSLCLSVCLSLSLPLSLFLCLSVCLSACHSVCLSVCLSLSLSLSSPLLKLIHSFVPLACTSFTVFPTHSLQVILLLSITFAMPYFTTLSVRSTPLCILRPEITPYRIMKNGLLLCSLQRPVQWHQLLWQFTAKTRKKRRKTSY